MNRNTLKQWLKETAALMMLMCCAAGAVYAGLGESSVMNTASKRTLTTFSRSIKLLSQPVNE